MQAIRKGSREPLSARLVGNLPFELLTTSETSAKLDIRPQAAPNVDQLRFGTFVIALQLDDTQQPRGRLW